MTKDFNQQRRGDGRPSYRKPPSSRYGEERSPRRPRLNRQTVDRGWESGARHEHADYHTRSHQGPHDNWRRNQYSDSPSAHNGRRPYGNHQDNYQRSERTPNRNANPRARSFDSHTRHSDDRYPGDRRNYSDRPPSRRGFRDNEQYREPRDRDQGYERRGFDRDSRSSRNFDRGNRSPRDYHQRNRQNPRWQSRPMAQNDDHPRGKQDFGGRERFEGDYEHFETPETPRSPVSRSTQSQSDKETEERQVTRLPDGRVLKGPRPIQRKNAQFWTEVAHDADALVGQVDSPAPVSNAAPTKDDEPKARRKPRISSEGATSRGKKTGAKQSTAKPRSTGPKPSQRGFKWPTP